MKTIKNLAIILSTFSFIISQEINLQITNYSDGVVELFMENSEPVAGIQFNLNSTLANFSINNVFGCSA